MLTDCTRRQLYMRTLGFVLGWFGWRVAKAGSEETKPPPSRKPPPIVDWSGRVTTYTYDGGHPFDRVPYAGPVLTITYDSGPMRVGLDGT